MQPEPSNRLSCLMAQKRVPMNNKPFLGPGRRLNQIGSMAASEAFSGLTMQNLLRSETFKKQVNDAS
jgi:hypothetical protein